MSMSIVSNITYNIKYALDLRTNAKHNAYKYTTM